MTYGAGVRGTGRPRKIDPAVLAELIGQGASFRDVQDRFNVTRKSVMQACEREGLPYPRTSRVAGEAAEEPVKSTPTGHPPRVADLIATGGRYAALRQWAERWGFTETKARQEWHKLRLPVGKAVRT